MPEPTTLVALPSLAEQIERAHQRASQSARTALDAAFECGRLLAEAKASLAYGEWLPWLSTTTTVSARQAQKYIRLHTHRAALESKYVPEDAFALNAALAAVATPRDLPALGTPDEAEEDPWAWAEQQVAAPINRIDVGNPSCLQAKLLAALGVPPVVSILLGMAGEYPRIRVLRLAPEDELLEAARLLAPVATGKAPLPEMDTAGMTANDLLAAAVSVKLTAQRLIGMVVTEVDVPAQRARERPSVHARLLEEIDVRLADCERRRAE